MTTSKAKMKTLSSRCSLVPVRQSLALKNCRARLRAMIAINGKRGRPHESGAPSRMTRHFRTRVKSAFLFHPRIGTRERDERVTVKAEHDERRVWRA